MAGLDEIDAGRARRSCWESSYDRERKKRGGRYTMNVREEDMSDK